MALTLPVVQVVKRYIKREFSSRIQWNPGFWTKSRFPWICFGQTQWLLILILPSIFRTVDSKLPIFRINSVSFQNLHSISRPLKIQEPTKTGFWNQNTGSRFRRICFGQTFYPRFIEPSNRSSQYFELIYSFSCQKLTFDFSNFENSGTKRKKQTTTTTTKQFLANMHSWISFQRVPVIFISKQMKICRISHKEATTPLLHNRESFQTS